MSKIGELHLKFWPLQSLGTCVTREWWSAVPHVSICIIQIIYNLQVITYNLSLIVYTIVFMKHLSLSPFRCVLPTACTKLTYFRHVCAVAMTSTSAARRIISWAKAWEPRPPSQPCERCEIPLLVGYKGLYSPIYTYTYMYIYIYMYIQYIYIYIYVFIHIFIYWGLYWSEGMWNMVISWWCHTNSDVWKRTGGLNLVHLKRIDE